MKTTPTILRAEQLRDLGAPSPDSTSLPLYPGILTHVYIRLDMDERYECPSTSEDALSYLGAVAKAATVIETIARACEGTVLEVQGSTVHVGLPEGDCLLDGVGPFASAVHTALQASVGPVYRAVTGWRMTADTGKTLVVPGRGVHGDLSFVSLGNSANRPAKHLYAQLSLPERNRHLKKYHLGVRNLRTDEWFHTPLNRLADNLQQRFRVAASTAREDFTVRLITPPGGGRVATAQAVPIGQPGSTNSPTADQPGVFFGWVMRADLDGFTQRVQDCLDKDDALMALGQRFVRIMDAAADFTAEHDAFMVQLPWAGDNFTAAVVFGEKDVYDGARSTQLVEHALDFGDRMDEDVDPSDFDGWAYGIGGADVHGNAGGNVFIGSVEFDERRFLIGAGQGFARSLQAFADLKPGPDVMAVYTEDHAVFDPMYKPQFSAAKKTDGATSDLFKIAQQNDLRIQRLEPQTKNQEVTISAAGEGTTSIPVKPYAHE